MTVFLATFTYETLRIVTTIFDNIPICDDVVIQNPMLRALPIVVPCYIVRVTIIATRVANLDSISRLLPDCTSWLQVYAKS